MKKVYYLIIVLLSFAAYTSADNKIKRPESYNYQRGLEAMQNEKFDEAIDAALSFYKKKLEYCISNVGKIKNEFGKYFKLADEKD